MAQMNIIILNDTFLSRNLYILALLFFSALGLYQHEQLTLTLLLMEIILLLVEFPKTSVQKQKVLEMPKCSCLKKIPTSFLSTLRIIREIKKG